MSSSKDRENLNNKELVVYTGATQIIPYTKTYSAFVDPALVASNQDKIQVGQLNYLIALGVKEFTEIQDRMQSLSMEVKTQGLALTALSNNVENVRTTVENLPTTITRLTPVGMNTTRTDFQEVINKLVAIETALGKKPMELDPVPVAPKQPSEALNRLNTLVANMEIQNQRLQNIEASLDRNINLIKEVGSQVQHSESSLQTQLGVKIDNIRIPVVQTDGTSASQIVVEPSQAFLIFDPPQSFTQHE